MKRHLTLAIPVALIVIGIAAGFFTASALESPRSRLLRLIEPDIEAAQRMLQDYDPTGMRLATLLGEPGGQEAEIDSEQWREFLAAGEEQAGLGDALRAQERTLRELLEKRLRIDGTTVAPPAVPNPAEAYPQLLQKLENNGRRLEEALRRVQAALSATAGSGESEVRGDSSPAATHLEARLLYHQADLLQRRAALHRAQAERHRGRVAELVRPFRTLAAELHSLEAELAGSEAGLASASRPAAAPEPKTGASPATHRPGAIARFFSSMFSAGRGDAETDARPPAEAAAEAPPPPAPDEPIRLNAVPSMARLIEERRTMRGRTESELREAQAVVEELQGKVRDLEDRIAQARAAAAEAEQAMLAMEKNPPDPSDPAATEAFVTEYERLAAEHRRAGNEAAILSQGAVRNARPDTQDDELLATAPLVPVRPDLPMQPERGLEALKTDLAVARGLVETRQALIQELDRQIAELETRNTIVKDRTGRVRAAQQELAARAAEDAAAAMAESAEADRLEQEGIELASGQGLRAAQRARRAAEAAIREAGDLNSTNPPDKPNPRLDLLAKARFTTGHAQAIEGDLNLVIATVYARKADDLEQTVRMNALLAKMGVPPVRSAAKSDASAASPSQEPETPAEAHEEPAKLEAQPQPASADQPVTGGEASAAPADAADRNPAGSAEQPDATRNAADESDKADAPEPGEPGDAGSPEAPEGGSPPAAEEPEVADNQEREPSPQAEESPPGVEDVYGQIDPSRAATLARQLANTHALAALEAYQQAADGLGNLWVVHANIAAVKFFLAGLAPAAERPQLLEQARKEYDRALRNREDRPEFAAYDQARRQLILTTGGELPPTPLGTPQPPPELSEAQQPRDRTPDESPLETEQSEAEEPEN